MKSRLFVDEAAFFSYGYSNTVLVNEPITLTPAQVTWMKSQYPVGTPITAGPQLLTTWADGTITTDEITFSWSNVGAARYELYVDNTQGFGSSEIAPYNIPALRNLTGTAYTISGNWLQRNEYYWKVKAFFSNNTTAESTVGHFFYYPPTLSAPAWVPLYRLYKGGQIHDHFYATSDYHRQTAINSGYTPERVEGYLSLYRFNDADMVEVFRFFNSAKSCHYYTTSSTDRDNQIIAGLTYEGITGFAYKNPRSELMPLYHLHKIHSPTDDDRFYTISEFERSNAQSAIGYTDQGLICYVSPNGDGIEVPIYESQSLIGAGVNTQNGNFNFYTKTSFDIPSFGLALA
ncbi:MAG: hypothetical protein ACRENG_37435, partial [bacterium]